MLRVRNGIAGQCPAASSGEIQLNGVAVVRPDDFNPQVALIERTVAVLADNTLVVEVRSGPGTCVAVEVLGQDDAPPEITASADPPPNAAGWNRNDVTVTFTCSDAESGIATCPSPVVLSSEGTDQPVSGTALDRAGNSATATLHLSIDKTGPSVTSAVSPMPNTAGWNNSDATVTFTCSDTLSGVAACPDAAPVTSEGAAQSVSGTAVDVAGNSSTATASVSLDKTSPAITPDASPAANAAGWHNSDVTVTFACSDGVSGVATCPDAAQVTTEGEAQTVSGTAVDVAGNTASTELSVNLDKTPPQIVAAPASLPNVEGWYREDVAVSFVCDDLHLLACPSPMTVTTEGAEQPVAGAAVDLAGNTATATLSVSLDKTPPALTAMVAPAANAAGWNRTDVAVTFAAEDALSGIASVTPPQTLSDEGAGQAVNGAAVDRAGNVATADAVVNIDKTPPELALTAPADGTVRRVPRVDVTGTATDLNGIAVVSVEGVRVSVASPFAAEVTLTEGPRTIVVEARDVADNPATASVSVAYSAPPVVKITAPADLTAVGSTPIVVSGTVDDPQATVVVGLERIPAVVSGNTFTATGVPLREGGNVLTAVATDTLGNAGSDAITVVLDTTAPRVVIVSPPDGSATTSDTVTVSGMVNDIVIGTVNTPQAQVTVNGTPAMVSHRSFVVENVPLAPGPNTLTAVATDAVGNGDIFVATVIRETVAGPRLEVVSGSGQTAGINEQLAEPLVLAVINPDGTPLPGRTVVFRVAENNGLVSDGQQTASGLALTTDAAGRAQVRYTLGSRAGAGNNRVEVTSPGIEGAAVFTASAVAHPPSKVNLDSGNNQKGVVGQPLPRPFVVVVTDEGHNRLADVPVTFKVVAGDGSFNSTDMVTVTSDSDGRALAVLTLGPRPGTENNVVEARVENLAGLPAGFSASGFEPGDPAETRISGVVLDNANVPIPGVTLRVRNTALARTADDQGQFLLAGVPVGNVHLVVDGTTAQRLGTWPSLEYELVTVAGANNTVGMPIYLVALDTTNGIFVDETHGGTLTLPDYPGFSLTVAPNSATFPDGTRHGTITVTAVHPDKVPMVPNFGQQPRFIVTIQPPGVRFDPPAQVTHPNVDGLPPGAKTELYSFDHDMGSFVATGTATVSDDGAVIRSDPGAGVFKGGWHCGSDPSLAGTVADCPKCKFCNGTTCVPDSNQTGDVCGTVSDVCKVKLCSGGACLPFLRSQPERDSLNAQHTSLPDMRANCPGRVRDSSNARAPDGCGSGWSNALVPECLSDIRTGILEPFARLFLQQNCPEAAQDATIRICFTAACNVHDLCYETCEGSSTGHKSQCDTRFRDNLYSACDQVAGPQNLAAECRQCADAYVHIMTITFSSLNQSAYAAAQEEDCQCCP